jgi:hypothetical protein
VIGFILGWIYWYDAPVYQVLWREKNSRLDEFQPALIAKSIAVVYAYQHIASTLKVNYFFQLNTDVCIE